MSAIDKVTNKTVAIKKIRNVFEDTTKAKRILREIKLLRHFDYHDNLVNILDITTFPPEEKNIADVYIVCNLMESDMDQIIKSPQSLSSEHNQYFIYQVLRALKYVHSADVVHRGKTLIPLISNSTVCFNLVMMKLIVTLRE